MVWNGATQRQQLLNFHPGSRGGSLRNISACCPGELCGHEIQKALVGGGSAKTTRCSTGYVRVRSEVDIPEFKVALEGHRFPGRRNGEAAAAVEYAPFQRVPASKVKRDPKEGTIEQGVLSALVYVRAYICVYTFWSVDKRDTRDPRGATIEQIVLPVPIYIPVYQCTITYVHCGLWTYIGT